MRLGRERMVYPPTVPVPSLGPILDPSPTFFCECRDGELCWAGKKLRSNVSILDDFNFKWNRSLTDGFSYLESNFTQSRSRKSETLVRTVGLEVEAVYPRRTICTVFYCFVPSVSSTLALTNCLASSMAFDEPMGNVDIPFRAFGSIISIERLSKPRRRKSS